MVQKHCQHCGGIFQVQASRFSELHYCSRACANEARMIRNRVICKICGKVFTASPSHRLKGARFCSRACAIVDWSRTSLPPEFRFWRHVEFGGGCWLWTGAKGPFGHGSFCVDVENHTKTTAHRYAWILLRGPVDENLFVCHDCPDGDNPTCVRPDHMFLGTQGDNMRDAAKKGKMTHLGETNNAAKLTDEQVIAIRKLHSQGRTQVSLAEEFGVWQGTIWQIIRGNHWKHLLPKDEQLTML